MSPRLASRITGTSGATRRMWAISSSSWSSARWAAKYAICGLNAITRSFVASTMRAQKSKMRAGSPRIVPGNFDGSGSSPTHSIDWFFRSARWSWALKSIRAAPRSDLAGERGGLARVGTRRHREQALLFRFGQRQPGDETLHQLARHRLAARELLELLVRLG